MFEHFVGRVFLFDPPPQEQLPLVEIPLVSQDDNVPNSLLIQMDQDDLTPTSQERLAEYLKGIVLPFYILKQNSGIEPQDQVQLAKRIIADNKYYLLSWSSYPSWDQLEYACELIWQFFVKRGGSGVYSAKQLAFRINSLSDKLSIKSRVLKELNSGKYSAKSPNEAVERVLSFDRNWASYEFPRFLMALSHIQEHILSQKGYASGDYSYYATQVESFFDNSLLVSLDEYGIPPIVGKKAIQGMENVDIDTAIQRLKKSTIRASELHEFERDVLIDSIKAM